LSATSITTLTPIRRAPPDRRLAPRFPRPLTPAEKAALQAVFEPHLAWPPRVTPAEPLQLKQAARRLDITASAVKVRLEGARAKAELLGLERPAGVTDPAYLYVLVAAKYLRPPSNRCRFTAFE